MNEIHTGASKPVSIGVSSCLLGNNVRYDGGNMYNSCVVEVLQKHYHLEAYCPELAIGLGVPRPPIQLVKTASGIKALGVENRNLDVTRELQEYVHLSREGFSTLDGFILKSKSPSCGLEKVKLFSNPNHYDLTGQGLFAGQIARSFPLLPVEDEISVSNPEKLESFLQRVLLYHRWSLLQQGGLTSGGLVSFHTAHKYLFLLRSESRYRELVRILSRPGITDLETMSLRYMSLAMQTLKIPGAQKKQVKVFTQLLGILKQKIPIVERQELLRKINQFSKGEINLNTIKTIFAHTFKQYPDEVLQTQYFLDILPGLPLLTHKIQSGSDSSK